MKQIYTFSNLKITFSVIKKIFCYINNFSPLWGVCLRNEELLQEWRNQAKIMQERKILEHKQDQSERHRKDEVEHYFLISYFNLKKTNK